MEETLRLTLPVSDRIGLVSALVNTPENMRALLVLAHGAGAGMNHSFMSGLSTHLSRMGVGTFRYNFPYMEKGSKRPDVPAVAQKAVAAAIQEAHKLFPEADLFAGGKSFGGRMTSQYLAQEHLPYIKGIVFVGFPLHPPGKPGTERADHLKGVQVPMLFLQGTRDTLAQIDLVNKVVSTLPAATVEVFDGADHSFKAGKKVLLEEVALATQKWMDRIAKVD